MLGKNLRRKRICKISFLDSTHVRKDVAHALLANVYFSVRCLDGDHGLIYQSATFHHLFIQTSNLRLENQIQSESLL